jgi:hypothetical protein
MYKTQIIFIRTTKDQLHIFFNYLYIQTNAHNAPNAQNTRGTPTVYHDSGVGANKKNHGTTAATNRRPTKQVNLVLKTPLKMARGWRRNMSGKF